MNVSISFLGGVGEIGMNMYLYETDTTAIIVDCGVKFASKGEPGIDVIIPDFTYLYEIKDKLKAVIITHAHEDHIGALPFLLTDFNIPVVASHFSHALIKRKMKEYHIKYEKIYFEKNISVEINDFIINFIPLSHSIYGTGALYIQVNNEFSFLHMSDYKIDFSPVSSDAFPIKEFVEISKNKLDCLVSDSTNCLVKGFTKGEKSVEAGLDEIFKNANGRIFFTSFASNAERIETIFKLSKKYNRKIIIEGSSFTKNISEASHFGLLNIDHSIIVKRSSINKLADNEICFIATGSQGEKESVITRIAHHNYANIKIKSNDLFIFSSRAIPSNEQDIINVMNRITKAGGKCITAQDLPIHVSGHPAENDVAFLIKLTKPKYLIPIHGEYIHMEKHKEIAINTCNIDKDNVIISNAGTKVVFNNGYISDICEVPAGKRFVDYRSKEILSKDSLKYRKLMATDGVVFAYININNNIILSSSIIANTGFVDNNESNAALNYLIAEANKNNSIDKWENFVETTLKRYYKKFLQRRPIINIIVRENI